MQAAGSGAPGAQQPSAPPMVTATVGKAPSSLPLQRALHTVDQQLSLWRLYEEANAKLG